MTAYLVLVIFATAIARMGRLSGSVAIRRLSIGLIVLVLTLFAGIRDRSVGTDTGNYVQILLSVSSYEDLFRTTEVGFNALMLLSSAVDDGYVIFLVLIAFIVVGSYVSVMVRTTKRYETALFIFIAFGAYTFFFNGARQGIATAICFLALPSLLERRKTSYFFFIGLAAVFHHTALIAAPLYFVSSSRVGLRQLVWMSLGSVALTIFLRLFVQAASFLLDDKYAVYAEEGEGGGRVMVAFLVSQGVLLYLVRNAAQNVDKRYHRLLNIYLIGLVPAVAATIASVNPSGLLRLSTYFSHTAVLLWPIAFLAVRSNLGRALLSLGFIITAFTFFAMTTSAFSNLVPYQINRELNW